jgi:hypothetical protein
MNRDLQSALDRAREASLHAVSRERCDAQRSERRDAQRVWRAIKTDLPEIADFVVQINAHPALGPVTHIAVRDADDERIDWSKP